MFEEDEENVFLIICFTNISWYYREAMGNQLRCVSRNQRGVRSHSWLRMIRRRKGKQRFNIKRMIDGHDSDIR